jgi:diguanylate cyclase (GGDEF)-like protein
VAQKSAARDRARLVEANEQLVVATLRAQSDAETSAQALKEASRLAEHDALTDLPNRVLLLDRLTLAIANARRRGIRLALLFVDIDHFKEINDALGHAAGDEVLKQAARCLMSSIRMADTVSRHGGDEFLILLTELSQAADVVPIAEKVIVALAAPNRVGDHVLRLRASIGISLYPEDGPDAETLIDRADAAMYRAKRQALGRYVFHGDAPVGERSRSALVVQTLQQPLAHYRLALAEHERRHAQLREANEQLVLAALSAEELRVAAELAQRRQTEFLAVLAHELRNPLTPIRTMAALLGRVPTDETLLPRVQSVIQRQVVHLSRLVDDLLDVSRVHTGKLRLEVQAVEMADIINDAVDVCRPAMDTRLQHFVVKMPRGALQVQGDPVRLAQIVSNLLDNASKYTQDGGEIGLGVVLNDEAMVMTLSDNGIGITAEALPTVFEPFVQDASAIAVNEMGLGLGLTVVRQLTEAHGGSVVASSAGSGLGSTFVVTLPLAGPPAKASAPDGEVTW